MKSALANAITAIKTHPYTFLYDSSVQSAFREISANHSENILEVSVPDSTIDKKKLDLLPVPYEQTDGKYIFPWFPMEHDIGTAAVEFVDVLIKGLNALPEAPIPTPEEVKEIKEKYKPGTKITAIPKDDFLSPTNTQ